MVAVELRLGEKSTRRFEDVIGPAQCLVLALELFEAFTLAARQAIALAWRDYLREQLRDWLPADKVESAETDAAMVRVVTRLIRESASPGRHALGTPPIDQADREPNAAID